MLATSSSTTQSPPQQRRRNTRGGPQPKPPTVTEAIQAHLPRLSQNECTSIGPILVSVGLELLSRLRPNLASSTFASVTSLIADWLEGLAVADQESLDRIRGGSGPGANRHGTARDSKYFNDAYQVYPAWWGHKEALPSTLPAVATSAVELLAKWNLRGAVIESAARSVDQGLSPIDSVGGTQSFSPRKLSRAATVPPPWAARRMVDEFIQTDPASLPNTDGNYVPEHDTPGRRHVQRTQLTSHSPPATQPTHTPARRSVSPEVARRRSPSASRRATPVAEKGGFFFLPMDTASASTRRPVAPPNIVRRSQPGQSTSSSPSAQTRAGPTPAKPAVSRQQRPLSTSAITATRTASPTKSTPGSSAPAHRRSNSPVKPPTSFTVPGVGSIFPVDSDKVQRMVTVAQTALADDFCAIFSSDDEDTSAGGNTTESVDAVRFPSKMTNEVDRKREVRSRDARMGVGKEWYKKEWAVRDRAGVAGGDEGQGKDGDEEKRVGG